jgi:lysophospholipase L1-like esterase
MLPCIIVGDSIAQGMAHYAKECHSVAQVGINTSNFVKKFPHIERADITVVSIGTNDGNKNTHTVDNLRAFRKTVKSLGVIWLLPNPKKFPVAFDAVNKVAAENSDHIYDVQKHLSPKMISGDKVHPNAAGYKFLASDVLASMD